MNKKEENFNKTCQALFNELKEGEDLTLSLQAEESKFIRFNGSKVRQSTDVEQGELGFTYMRDKKRIEYMAPYTGDFEEDVLHHVAAVRALKLELFALKRDVAESPTPGTQHTRQAHFAGGHERGQAHGSARGVSGRPTFA